MKTAPTGAPFADVGRRVEVPQIKAAPGSESGAARTRTLFEKLYSEDTAGSA